MNTDETSTTTLEGRFSFDASGHELPPDLYEATPAELAAQYLAADRSRIHRRSVEMAAPECRIDRNLYNRILITALVVERESYKHRARYQHRGALGDLGVDLLRALMSFGRKHGQIFPCYKTLAYMMRKDPETVIEAMKRLIRAGFVTKHRRSKVITTAQGARRVQDSNAYEVQMPNAGLATVPVVAGKATSGSENSDVSNPQAPDIADTLAPRPKDERFWLAEPYRMADGSYY